MNNDVDTSDIGFRPAIGPCNNSFEELTFKVAHLDAKVAYLEKLIPILTPNFVPAGTTDMAYKITRTVTINGQQRWIRANSEQEYAEKLLKLYAGDTAPVTVSAGKHDFATYAMSWFEIYSRPNIATATASTYERQLKKIILPHFEGISVEDVTIDHVQLLFNGMSGAKSSKEKTKTVLGMVLDMAVEDGLLQRNPLKSKRLKISGASSQTRKPYTVEEMQYIVGHLGQVQSLSDRNFLALIALHPLRLEEVLGLKWDDIDLEQMVIHVRRAVTHPNRSSAEIKETKTAASMRDVALTVTALQHLVPGKPGDFVCGERAPYSYTQVRHMRTRIAKDIDFTTGITPARFRPTVLTDIYEQTKDVKKTQAAAGHTTAAMTFKHYVNGRNTASAVTATAIDSIYGSVPC
ncbi:MAG: hypothetical protein E7472_04675 [Ruminococcaceae bacterium]|nr:hypothetical protein [Oscillospiraceae bacterium]